MFERTVASLEPLAVASTVRMKQGALPSAQFACPPSHGEIEWVVGKRSPGGYGSCFYRSVTASGCSSAQSWRAEIQEVPSGTESRVPCEQTLIPLLGALPGRASGVRKLAADHNRLPT